VVSDAVYENVKNKAWVNAVDNGWHELKGVADPVRVYSVDA
jgi:class 3 adenylate cyclase